MATKDWVFNIPIRSVMVATLVLEGGDTSTVCEIPNYQDKTIHVYAAAGGQFGTSTVSVKGSNVSTITAQDLHRTNDPAASFTSVAVAVLAHVLENPRYITASASAGSGAGLTVVITAVTPRG